MAKASKQRRGSAGYTWDDLVAAVGQDFSGGEVITADEPISYTDVVQYCEPWEIGCPIYWDEQAARQYGYRGVVVPWSAIKQTFCYSGFWRPGQPPRFATSEPNFKVSQGAYMPRGTPLPMPMTGHELVTHMEIEFFEPVVVGDRLHAQGKRLVQARPKQTNLGFGAFITLETEVYNHLGQMVARVREGLFRYNRDAGPQGDA